MSDLRPRVTWFIRWGNRTLGYEYGQDVGNLHVIDYIITKARVGKTPWPGFESTHLRISPADWSRS